MDLFLNDLSLHGQFLDLDSFYTSLNEVMRIREVARKFGRTVYCRRNFAQGLVTNDVTIPMAVGKLPPERRRAVMSWLNQHGPFWEDEREHGCDEWYECRGEIVTDTAVGEAAHCMLHGIDRSLVSLAPSAYTLDPVPVDHVAEQGARRRVTIRNHWFAGAFEAFIASVPPTLTSWAQLRDCVTARFSMLTFSTDSFSPLEGHPFVSSAAQRIVVLLNVLDQMKQHFTAEGSRTPAGHQLYQDYFTGKKGSGGRGAAFSDSSDDEKNEFSKELTFRNPTAAGETLFCSWHGKVQTPQMRIHFSHPIRKDEPLFVVYVGPKITKW